MYQALFGGLALSGFPLITSGFWSKDEILADAFREGYTTVYWMLSIAAFFTAFYMGRQIWMVFFGGARHEAAAVFAADASEERPLELGQQLVLGLVGHQPEVDLGLSGTRAEIRERVRGQRINVRKAMETEYTQAVVDTARVNHRARLKKLQSDAETVAIASLLDYPAGITGKLILQSVFARNLKSYEHYKKKVHKQVKDRSGLKGRLLGQLPKYQGVPATQQSRYFIREVSLWKHVLKDIKPAGYTRQQTEKLHDILMTVVNGDSRWNPRVVGDIEDLFEVRKDAAMMNLTAEDTLTLKIRANYLKALIWEYEGRPTDIGSVWLIANYPVIENQFMHVSNYAVTPDDEAMYLIEQGLLPTE